MRDGADDQQADDGALQEDDEQLPDVERKLGAEDQTADLGEVKHLRDGDDRDNKLGHLAGGLRDQDGGGEHVGEADDHRGGNSVRFGHLKKLEQRAERDAEPFKDRRVVGKDQCDGTDGHDGGQNAEPHAAGVLGAAGEALADALVLRDALEREMRRNLMTLSDEQRPVFMEALARRNRCNSVEEMYAAIGYGGLQISRMLPKLKEEWQKLKASEEKAGEDLPKVDLSRVHATDGVVVEGFDNTPIKFAKCCSPLPGDPIVGFITRGFGVSIHKQSCANAISSMKDPTNAPRWVKAYWADSVKDSYKAGLEIIALNRNELLQDVLAALADIRVPIYALNARQVENNCAVVSLTIGINNTEHLNRVVARLSKVKDVLKVTRS